MPTVRRKYIDELLMELARCPPAAASKLRNIIDKIGTLADKNALQRLIPFLAHDAESVRASVVLALAKIRGKGVVSQLLPLLKQEQSPVVRLAIIEALGACGDRTALEPLVAIKQDPGEDDKIKIGATFAIDRVTGGEQPAVDQLVEYLIDSKHPHTRIEAARTLGKLGDPRAITPLIAALEDDRVFVRKMVIKALVEFGDKRAVDPIIDAFKDEKVFLEREFVSVLWAFPDYDGKELWEIIDARNAEKLRAAPQAPPATAPVAGKAAGSIMNDYAYEAGKGCAPEDARATGAGSTAMPCPAVPRQDGTGELTMQESIDRARREAVPDQKSSDEIAVVVDELGEYGMHFSQGEKAYRKKQYFEALVHFKKALALKYDAWQAWYNMGLIFYDVDEKDKSIQCFHESLRFKPNEVDTMLNLASLHAEASNYDGAITWFSRALALNRHLSDAWLMLGKVLHKLQKGDQALFCFNQVLQTSNDKRERAQARKASEAIIKDHPDVVATDPRKAMPTPRDDDKLKLAF